MNIREQLRAHETSVGRDDHRDADMKKFRMLAAAAVLVSAAVHPYLWLDVFRQPAVVGHAFVVNVVGGTIIVALLVMWRALDPASLPVLRD